MIPQQNNRKDQDINTKYCRERRLPADRSHLFRFKCFTRTRIRSHLHSIFDAGVLCSNAIKEFLVGLRLEVPATATFILFLLRHLSFSPVMDISLSAFESNPASEVIISPIIRSEQNIGTKLLTSAVLPTHPPNSRSGAYAPAPPYA